MTTPSQMAAVNSLREENENLREENEKLKDQLMKTKEASIMKATQIWLPVSGYNIEIASVHDGFFVSGRNEEGEIKAVWVRRSGITEIDVPCLGEYTLSNGEGKKIVKPEHIGLYISAWEPTTYFMLRVKSDLGGGRQFKYLPQPNTVESVKDSSSGRVSTSIDLTKLNLYEKLKTIGFNPNLSVLTTRDIKNRGLFIREDAFLANDEQFSYFYLPTGECGVVTCGFDIRGVFVHHKLPFVLAFNGENVVMTILQSKKKQMKKKPSIQEKSFTEWNKCNTHDYGEDFDGVEESNKDNL